VIVLPKLSITLVILPSLLGIAETCTGVAVPCVRAEGERLHIDNIIVEGLGRKIIILLAEKAYCHAGMGENIRFQLRFLEDMYLFLRCPAFAVNAAESHPAVRHDDPEVSAVEQINSHAAYAHLSSDFGSLMSPRH